MAASCLEADLHQAADGLAGFDRQADFGRRGRSFSLRLEPPRDQPADGFGARRFRFGLRGDPCIDGSQIRRRHTEPNLLSTHAIAALVKRRATALLFIATNYY